MSKKHHNKSSNTKGGGKTNGVKHSTSSKPKATNGSSSSSGRGGGSSSWNIFHLIFALMSLFLGIIIAPSSSKNNNQGLQSRRGLFRDNTEETSTTTFTCDDQTLSNYLHDVPIPGLHLVCIDNSNGGGKKRLNVYKEAQVGNSNSVQITTDDDDSKKNDDTIQDWGSLKSILVQNLDLTPGDDLHQSWATFSPHGEKLLVETDPNDSSIDQLGDLGMFLVFQGGQWIWPGVRKGYQRTIHLEDSSNDDNNDTITLETLSLFPLVLSVRGFLSINECDYIQNRAEPEMKYSVVTLMDHDKDRKDSDFRTSQTTFLSSNESPILQHIDDRTASLVRMPKQHQEHVQVLRYGHTQNYVTHHDYFHPKLYSQDPNTLSLIQNGKRNRMATVFWYLSDVDEGGHTVFPRFDKGPEPPTSSSWDLGLKVKPEKGKVIVFYSMTPDGQLDPYSLHGAAPVGEGHVKWAANKWVWNMPMHFTR